MTSIILYFLSFIAGPFMEPDGYFIKPVISPYGIISTDNHCSALYLISTYNNGESKIEPLLTAPGCGRYFSLSPDGASIGFKLIRENGFQSPALYDLESRTMTELHKPEYQCGQVSFALNGAIAFTVGNESVVISGSSTRHYDLRCYSNLTPISPDASYAVFNDDNDQLWLIDLSDGARLRITDNKNGYCYPICSPDSRSIAYSTLGGHILVYDIASQKTYDIGDGLNPAWSADGDRLVYYVTETNERSLISSELIMTRFDGTQRSELTHTVDVFEMDPHFSDNDTKVIFHTFGARAICEGELRDNELKNVRVIYETSDPLTINHYRVQPDFGSRDSIDVPYYHQVYDTPSWHSGYWSCAPTTAIMAIAYYRKLPHWDCWCSSPYGHTSHFGRYICERYHYREVDYNSEALDYAGNTAWGGYGYMWYNGYSPHSRMANYINYHNMTSWTDDSPTWDETIAEFSAGYPYCICAMLTTAGHLVLAVGQVLNWRTLIFNDPYGNKNEGYMNYNGKYARYDWPGYNNGYQNLSTVAWCAGAEGAWEPATDTIADDLQFEDGFYLHTDSPSSMAYWWDALSGFRGHMWYTYTTGGTTDTCYATWTPVLPQAGDYEVFVYIPSIHHTATGARYIINHAGGSATVVVNQANYTDSWVSLGAYDFNTSGGSVRLADATGTTGQQIAFDAVKWSWRGTDIAESGQRTQILDQVYLGSNLVRLCLTLHITLADDARVQISIYDAAGRCVGKQAIGYLNQGPHIVNMNANDFVSGVYVIKTSVNDRYYYNKCVVLK